MTDKQKTDGVSNPPSEGESQGGAYPNPHTGKEDRGDGGGFDGGQSDKSYEGPENPNSTTP
jgi:hypothetical protein